MFRRSYQVWKIRSLDKIRRLLKGKTSQKSQNRFYLASRNREMLSCRTIYLLNIITRKEIFADTPRISLRERQSVNGLKRIWKFQHENNEDKSLEDSGLVRTYQEFRIFPLLLQTWDQRNFWDLSVQLKNRQKTTFFSEFVRRVGTVEAIYEQLHKG